MISPKICVVEGMDGVGKSTAAKGLAERIGASYIENPIPELKELRKVFDLQSTPLERFFFYMACNYALSEKILNEELEGSLVVDRYVASTVAYHNTLLEKDTSLYVDWDKLVIPDVSFYLVADEDTRIERMSLRGDKTRSDRFLEENISLARKIEKEYDLLTRNYAKIDTTNLGPQEVVDGMYDSIERRFRDGIREKSIAQEQRQVIELPQY